MKKEYILAILGITISIWVALHIWYGPESKISSTMPITQSSEQMAVKAVSVTMQSNNNSVPTIIEHKAQNSAVSLDTKTNETDIYIPPIGKPITSEPYQGDLNDHESYQAYGDAKERKLKQAFIKAAKHKIERLEALLKRGKAEGISADELIFAQEKIAGIREMSKKLQQELVVSP
ncbi:hypothetical protein PSECIP111854_02461 [Pseudoalteromonas sp. CIP111854]|uniref:Uncharacterized protein n=1 Tax=Pseudoalteromonas holothuriae TaxID=2963714 RepID=A0A9W4QZC2_9GAMM|nr:hypothetical protein [Pseudoalteromonas sp. CIP111854]CAH9059711.1 hypothetical protein PSECIP111854_02461 [Pseudoalteromonas sp. CIP111854]